MRCDACGTIPEYWFREIIREEQWSPKGGRREYEVSRTLWTCSMCGETTTEDPSEISLIHGSTIAGVVFDETRNERFPAGSLDVEATYGMSLAEVTRQYSQDSGWAFEITQELLDDDVIGVMKRYHRPEFMLGERVMVIEDHLEDTVIFFDGETGNKTEVPQFLLRDACYTLEHGDWNTSVFIAEAIGHYRRVKYCL